MIMVKHYIKVKILITYYSRSNHSVPVNSEFIILPSEDREVLYFDTELCVHQEYYNACVHKLDNEDL